MTTPQWALEKIREVQEKNLTILDLSKEEGFDALIEIPDEVFELSQLTELDLRNNQLTNLPESIAKLQNLTSLNLGRSELGNKEQTVTTTTTVISPEEIGSKPAIEELQNSANGDLESNQPTNIPKSIKSLQHWVYGDLDGNQLTSLPDSIASLQNLTSLDLGGNQLTNLPESITKLQNLKSLVLSGNKLASLPESIASLQNLKTLILRYNQLTNLPESIASLQNLTMLDLGGIQTTSRSTVTTLTAPDLEGNNARVEQLYKLVYENLGGNNLTSLPESIANLQNLVSLNLGGNQFTSLPTPITDLQNLRDLGLDSNQLTSLPESIAGLQNLEWLDLAGNQLTSLPESIASLQNLKELKVGGNQLTSLPKAIIKLKNLEWLELSGNQLTSLPESISKLQNLESLDLIYNKLISLPESITDLKNLKSLDLNTNKLISLPESISKFQNLESLNLSKNQLTNLPESITHLKNLISLDLSGNKLITPPQEVAEKGIIAIREYFRQLSEGQDYLYEAKLLILGEGGAGKTTLAKKIENSNYVLQDENSTEGVDVTTWSFPIDGGKSFRVNIWDFGGQEIYHSTHQFFLTKRSLYALVTDTRKEDTDFYYWLNVVGLLSDNSPLLIIKNEKQDRHRELNERQLRGQFENLMEVLATNFETNRGLDKVKAEIEHHIKNLSHIGSPLPKTWVKVRERLESEPRNYISLEEFLLICRENGFTQTKDSLQLSDYLNDIGVFLHFQDEPLLRRTVILKPRWGTDAVYKVLDNKTVIKNLGQFTRTDLDTIWDTPEYENMRDELLQLMMKFRLCYEIPAQKGAYIAPQLLTENQLEYEWDKEDNLLLRYTYEFMPKGILLQFIVVMSESIWNQNVWKSGVLLEKDKTYAEVIEYYGKREIQIRVSGAHKKELMTIIMHELDKIHFTYKLLKYDKLIPCNCTECKTKKEPYFYRFEILQKFVEDRQDQIQCQQSYKMVKVRGLIDDILERISEHEEHISPIVQKYYINRVEHFDGGAKMTDNNITINNSTIHGSVVAAESIKDSFNLIEKADIKDDLKEQLKQLNQAVETMVAGLPKEKAEEVADDMKRLAEEAVKPSPSKKWYSVSVDGLTKAAENLGKVGEPVVKLAGKVLALLAVA